ncbi:MAG: LysR family transcriptional regulator [Papillibacter sp.]|jgi:DNA-binding transcriptional LysR family regulator|nr:LysR family transcriptional regulator [Papillibacter sp.]
MEIRQLRTFLAVANARSFLGAAETLYISRQAVSKTIQQLEDELNIELFVRNQNGAMMTPAGIYFYPRAATLVADFDKLQKEMQSIESSYRPNLNIYMALGISYIFAKKLMDYSLRHKNEVTINIGACLDADCETILTERRADAILSFTPLNNKTADTSVILKSPVKLLVKKEHPLTLIENPSEEDFKGIPLLLYTGGNDFCPWWPEPAGKNDISSSDLDFLFSLLQEGEGILPLPEVMIQSHLNYAAVLPDYKDIKPCSIYYSILFSTYYDSLTYNLLASVNQDVFSS